ncbi:hypothetical protein SAMN03159341_12929 [Paenibacillus sp. 1_12]|nr:hypothetical protein SAMN03159341_12929 [Paenibacillus sp. 1_12]
MDGAGKFSLHFLYSLVLSLCITMYWNDSAIYTVAGIDKTDLGVVF